MGALRKKKKLNPTFNDRIGKLFVARKKTKLFTHGLITYYMLEARLWGGKIVLFFFFFLREVHNFSSC